MPLSSKGRAVGGVMVSLLVFAGFMEACGSSSSGGNNFNTTNGGGKMDSGTTLMTVPDGSTFVNNGDGGFNEPGDASFYSNDAFFAMDPPPCVCPIDGGPMDCNVDGGPGGTPMCPDDKNREGCPCGPVGTKAACWPGLRANRNLGDCKDGVTTCEMQNESELAWGPCVGAVLPVDGGTGPEACTCFSAGTWDIANISPCFEMENGSSAEYAVSTVLSGMTVMCPTESSPPPFPTPTAPWSTDSLTVDCAGDFKLCYTIKAGMASAPSPSDCTVVQVCVQGAYAMANVMQALPSLPGWAGTDPTCSATFVNSGGYGEMSVVGTAENCTQIGSTAAPLVFNRIPYCPLNNPPAGCSNGGTGMFGQ